MKNNKISENYLERVPVRNEQINWEMKDNKVNLLIENKGFFNRVAQSIFNKPKISYVHLDEMGSFVWPLIDGTRNIIQIGKLVEEHFGAAANPLYERLAKFFQILESYHFIDWK